MRRLALSPPLALAGKGSEILGALPSFLKSLASFTPGRDRALLLQPPFFLLSSCFSFLPAFLLSSFRLRSHLLPGPFPRDLAALSFPLRTPRLRGCRAREDFDERLVLVTHSISFSPPAFPLFLSLSPTLDLRSSSRFVSQTGTYQAGSAREEEMCRAVRKLFSLQCSTLLSFLPCPFFQLLYLLYRTIPREPSRSLESIPSRKRERERFERIRNDLTRFDLFPPRTAVSSSSPADQRGSFRCSLQHECGKSFSLMRSVCCTVPQESTACSSASAIDLDALFFCFFSCACTPSSLQLHLHCCSIRSSLCASSEDPILSAKSETRT